MPAPAVLPPEQREEPQDRDEPGEAQLMARVRAGDARAFEEIVRRHRGAMLSRCRRVVGADAAEDVVQVALLKAWGALRDGREVASLRGWLLTISRNCAIEVLREAHGRACVGGVEAVGAHHWLGAGAGPSAQLEQGLQLRATLAAVEALPQDERRALVSVAIQGRSGRETARALGVSEAAVRQLVFRARKGLRDAITVVLPAPLLRYALAGRRPWLRGGLHRAGAGGAPALSVPGRVAALLAAGAVASAPVTIPAIKGGGHPRTVARTLAPSWSGALQRLSSRQLPAPRAGRPRRATPAPRSAARDGVTSPVTSTAPGGAFGTTSNGVSTAQPISSSSSAPVTGAAAKTTTANAPTPPTISSPQPPSTGAPVAAQGPLESASALAAGTVGAVRQTVEHAPAAIGETLHRTTEVVADLPEAGSGVTRTLGGLLGTPASP